MAQDDEEVLVGYTVAMCIVFQDCLQRIGREAVRRLFGGDEEILAQVLDQGAAGWDLAAMEEVVIEAGQSRVIGTGLNVWPALAAVELDGPRDPGRTWGGGSRLSWEETASVHQGGLRQVDSLGSTERGGGSFGSTGGAPIRRRRRLEVGVRRGEYEDGPGSGSSGDDSEADSWEVWSEEP